MTRIGSVHAPVGRVESLAVGIRKHLGRPFIVLHMPDESALPGTPGFRTVIKHVGAVRGTHRLGYVGMVCIDNVADNAQVIRVARSKDPVANVDLRAEHRV